MRAMIFQQNVNEDAGCIAYLIGCGPAREAARRDPRRDPSGEGPACGGERAAAFVSESSPTGVLTRPDGVEVYPAQGGDSSCGGAMSSKRGSTIGFERRFTPALQAATADAFVKELMTGLPPK